MKKKYLIITFLIGCLLSIDIFRNTNAVAEGKPAASSLNISAGVNFKSGIIDNTEVDSITGATKIGAKAGVKTEIHVAKNFHFIETGLEYSYIPQEIKYNDPDNGINGKRKFGLNLLRLPLAYNMHFFNNSKGNPFFVTRFGISFSYLLADSIKDQGTVPDYSMKKWEMGALIGFVFYPFFDTGIFLDTYRGFTQLYKDKYHTKDGQGNLAGFTFGVQQRFPEIF
jgi:hypothetical protein